MVRSSLGANLTVHMVWNPFVPTCAIVREEERTSDLPLGASSGRSADLL